jgi:hypothetical protein
LEAAGVEFIDGMAAVLGCACVSRKNTENANNLTCHYDPPGLFKGGIRRPLPQHPNWHIRDATNENPAIINSHALETGLTISHLRGTSDSGMSTVYDGEDRTRAVADDDDRFLAALRSGSSPVAVLEADDGKKVMIERVCEPNSRMIAKLVASTPSKIFARPLQIAQLAWKNPYRAGLVDDFLPSTGTEL